MKWLKVNVRRTYNRKKLGEHFQADLKRLSRQLLAEKKRSILQNEGKCWTESYKYVKDVKKIGKIFLQLKLVMADILPIQ